MPCLLDCRLLLITAITMKRPRDKFPRDSFHLRLLFHTHTHTHTLYTLHTRIHKLAQHLSAHLLSLARSTQLGDAFYSSSDFLLYVY